VTVPFHFFDVFQAVGNIDAENIHITFVENMLSVYKKYKLLIQEVFKSDQNFMGALDKACSSVINHKFGKPVSKSPEFLAKYCDALLRKSSKGISDSEVSQNT
jgi:cullin 2